MAESDKAAWSYAPKLILAHEGFLLTLKGERGRGSSLALRALPRVILA